MEMDWSNYGSRKTKAQTSMHISAVSLAPSFFAYWKVSYLDLQQAQFQFSSSSLQMSRLVYVGLGGKPQRPVFSRRGPIIKCSEDWQVLAFKSFSSLFSDFFLTITQAPDKSV